MTDISATGTKVFLSASNTFPAGIWITAFADDKDAVSVETQNVSDTAMGPNGDMVSWGTPNPVSLKLGVIAASEDNENLALLLNANRVAKNKAAAKDLITAVIHYPDGKKVTCENGVIKDGPVMSTAASSARLNGNEYTFHFENVI